MGRLAVIRSGLLWSSDPDDARVDHAHAFSVLLVWDRTAPWWKGYVTTTDHHAVAFVAADLTDVAVQRWLSRLPAWRPELLVRALTSPGLHQIWRRVDA